MSFIVKDVTIHCDYDSDDATEVTSVTVTLDATSGATSNLLKGVGNDSRICITVPYGKPEQVMKAVRERIAKIKRYRDEEMTLFNALATKWIED